MKFSGLALLATVASTAAGTWIFHPAVQSDYTERYQVLDQPVSPKASSTDTGVWFCTSRGWAGHCQHFAADFEDCRRSFDFLMCLVLAGWRDVFLIIYHPQTTLMVHLMKRSVGSALMEEVNAIFTGKT